VSELERQAHEVKTWLRQHHASLVSREVAAGSRRQLDPAAAQLDVRSQINVVCDVQSFKKQRARHR